MLIKLKHKIKINLVLSILCFLIVIFPYLVVATYASPSADDFSNMNAVLNQTNSTFLGKAISQSVDIYTNWQGTYTGLLLCYLGGCIYHKFDILGMHIEYVFSILFFVFTILCLTVQIVKNLYMKKIEYLSLSFITVSLLLFVMLYNFDVSEVFYWHTGIAVYTMPLCFSLLSIALLLKNEVKVWDVIISSCLGFLGAGGSLDISAFTCGVAFLIAFYKSFVNKRINNATFVFIATFVGAILNVMAPGNYSRHAGISDQFPVLNAIKYSFSGVFKALWEYVGNGTLILMLLLCILFFNKLKMSGIKFVNPFLLAVILLIGSIIIDFPVYLGYAQDYFPTRCEFVRRVSMTLFVFAVLLDTIGWYAAKTDEKVHFTTEGCMGIVVAFAISMNACVPLGSWNNLLPFKMYNDIYFNSIDKGLTSYEDTTNTILYTLKTNPGQDVVINVPSYDSLGYLKTIGLSDDPTWWVNIAVAQYFGNKSIVFYVGQ